MGRAFYLARERFLEQLVGGKREESISRSRDWREYRPESMSGLVVRL